MSSGRGCIGFGAVSSSLGLGSAPSTSTASPWCCSDGAALSSEEMQGSSSASASPAMSRKKPRLEADEEATSATLACGAAAASTSSCAFLFFAFSFFGALPASLTDNASGDASNNSSSGTVGRVCGAASAVAALACSDFFDFLAFTFLGNSLVSRLEEEVSDCLVLGNASGELFSDAVGGSLVDALCVTDLDFLVGGASTALVALRLRFFVMA
mmetsp:Transcript_117462/g.191172  ORF Transcript_117462/g.191172 Transcript_117462/m.191172 type:complete len:213 (+) Transcript_117462:1297-1935(+)